jgi:DNA-binding response OmpR family regulator
MTAASLLIVEDNTLLSRSLIKGLREDGFEASAVSSGAEAIALIPQKGIDGIVLDLGLPDVDGLEVLREARAGGITGPILVLTARTAVESRVAALEGGADDYLVKPFEYAELVARIRALLRRAAAPRWAPLCCNGLVYLDDSLEVVVGADRIALSPREHQLLGFFLRRRGEVLTRAEILEGVYGYGFDPMTNVINVHIANVRRKLGTHAVQIETVRGVGYRLLAAEAARNTDASH